MSEVVNSEIIRHTQESLSKYIKRPPLTDKLLRKPPFRYLHDITTSVIRETGFLQGLYTQDELNPENIKDREAKLAFLEKLIAAVNLSAGVNITARPNKIVAGLDVAKTNELLQAIAKALDKKVDSSKAVEKILNKKVKGGSQQKKEVSKSKTNKAKTPDSKSNDSHTSDSLKKKTKAKTKTTEKPESRKVKHKEDVSPTKLPKKPSIEEDPNYAVKEDSNDQQKKSTVLLSKDDVEKPVFEDFSTENHENLNPKHDVTPLPPPSRKSSKPLDTDNLLIENEGLSKTKDEEVKVQESKPESEPESIREIQDIKPVLVRDDESKPEEELKRPQSARSVHRKKSSRKPTYEEESKSFSKNVSNEEGSVHVLDTPHLPKELLERKPPDTGAVQREIPPKRPTTAARPASARPGAPRVRDRGIVLLNDTETKVVSEPVNLIVDSKYLSKDDDEALVTVEAPVSDVAVDQVEYGSHLQAEEQGYLVSQILETQRELDTGITPEITSKVEISWGSGSKREHEAVAREVDKLRAAIQSLTRAANPLGKLIDFLQEDVESMQTELETWISTNLQLSKQLQAEERLTEEIVEPLAQQLEGINQLIEEQLEETSVVKAVIIRNDERLTRLLKSSSVHLPG